SLKAVPPDHSYGGDWPFTTETYSPGSGWQPVPATATDASLLPPSMPGVTGDAPMLITPYDRRTGDPITGSGEVYEQVSDVEFAGFGIPYHFTRTYRSRVSSLTHLGRNWDHNFNQRMIGRWFADLQFEGEDCDGSVNYHDGQLNIVHFTTL